MRRYRPSRPWPVGGLALVAAAGAVLAAGTISSAVDGGPEPAFAAAIRQDVRAHAANPPAARATPAAAMPASAPSERLASGAWQIQVGAFRNAQSAEAHLRALKSEMPELARLDSTHQLRGKIDRVRLGGIEDEPAARDLCARVRAAGRGCFVVRPGS